MKVKRTAELPSFLEKVFCFLWGVVKLYNVLGGYDVSISITAKEVCTNLHNFFVLFYAL